MKHFHIDKNPKRNQNRMLEHAALFFSIIGLNMAIDRELAQTTGRTIDHGWHAPCVERQRQSRVPVEVSQAQDGRSDRYGELSIAPGIRLKIRSNAAESYRVARSVALDCVAPCCDEYIRESVPNRVHKNGTERSKNARLYAADARHVVIQTYNSVLRSLTRNLFSPPFLSCRISPLATVPRHRRDNRTSSNRSNSPPYRMVRQACCISTDTIRADVGTVSEHGSDSGVQLCGARGGRADVAEGRHHHRN